MDDARGSTGRPTRGTAAGGPRAPRRGGLGLLGTRSLDRLSDEELVARTRAGAAEPFEVLWLRHADAGRRAASRFTRASDPDDLVQEAYLRIYSAVSRGKGPDGPFRPYLYQSIRNIAISWAARPQTDSVDLLPDLTDGSDISETVLESTVTARAFRTLPARWQEVLWYSEVEGLEPADIAPMLAMTPSAVSALAYRAREGLRRAWLQAHVTSSALPEECRWSAEHMGDANRGALSGKARARFDEHVEGCARCMILVGEVDEVSKRLGLVLVPLLVGIPWATFQTVVADTAAVAAVGTAGVGTAGVAAGSDGGAAAGAAGVPRPRGGQAAKTTRRAGSVGLAVAVVVGLAVVSTAVVLGSGMLGGPEAPAAAGPAVPGATSTAAPPASTPSASEQPGEEPVSNPEDAPTLDVPPPSDPDAPLEPWRDLPDPPAPPQPHTPAALPPLPTLPPLAPYEPVAPTRGPSEPSEPSGEPSPQPSETDGTGEPSPEPSPTDGTGEPSPQPTDPSPEPTDPTTEPTENPTTEPTPDPPAVPTLTGPASGSGLTTFPTVSGTADPGVTVVLTTTGGDVLSTVLADDAGHWETPVCHDATGAAPAACLADTDTFSVQAHAWDEETELTSEPSDALRWTFDRPTLTVPAGGGQPVSGDISVSLAGKAGQLVQVSINGQPTGRYHLMPQTGTLNWSDVQPGEHSMSVRYVTTTGPGNTGTVTAYGPNRTTSVTVLPRGGVAATPPGDAPVVLPDDLSGGDPSDTSGDAGGAPADGAPAGADPLPEGAVEPLAHAQEGGGATGDDQEAVDDGRGEDRRGEDGAADSATDGAADGTGPVGTAPAEDTVSTGAGDPGDAGGTGDIGDTGGAGVAGHAPEAVGTAAAADGPPGEGAGPDPGGLSGTGGAPAGTVAEVGGAAPDTG